MGQWIFTELCGAVRRNPQEAELFKDEQSEAEDYAGNDHLVREVIQNSLDARSKDSNGPVKIKLSLHETNIPKNKKFATYYQRLEPAFEGNGIQFLPSGIPDLKYRFLVCEDFGTRGLEGDPTLFSDPPENKNSRQDFYWFWRNIGRSGKTGEDLGRWGLGKTVFRAVSQVGCMFGLTIRESDKKPLLMGQAVLQTHQYKGIDYHPEGYWCRESDDDIPMPIDEPNELAKFCEHWNITRKDEPGTSVVSPFVPEELSDKCMLQAVIIHFFTRILRGELEVEISGTELDPIKVNAKTIMDEASKITWQGKDIRRKRHAAPPIEFAQKCLKTVPEVETKLLGTKRAPNLNEGALEEEELTKLQEKFANEELVSLCVQMVLPRKNGENATGKINVYVQRNTNGTQSASYYVREGMTIPKLNSQSSKRGIQALVIVDSGPMAELLGDSENPAHEEWIKSSDRVKKLWNRCGVRIDFARRIVDNVVEYLTPPVDGPDRNILSDFFSIEFKDNKQKAPKQGNEKDGNGFVAPPPSEPKWFHITDRSGGFTISRNQHVEKPLEASLKVSMAYDIPKGNPLRNWNKIDFEIPQRPTRRGLKLEGDGIRVKREQGNIIRLEEIKDDFKLEINGFDKYRDLYVRVDDLSGTDESEDETND